MTMRFRCVALSSNAVGLDVEAARKNGIDAFVNETVGKVVDIEGLAPDELRRRVGEKLRDRIENAKRANNDRVYMTLGYRSDWTAEDLAAVKFGIIDGAAALDPHPIDYAYPPTAFALDLAAK
jgi:hypothetical protein